MKRILKPFVILLSAMFLAVSCLNDNTSDVTYYSDTAITSFSLGTLNRTMWATASTGEDSSYVDELDCSSYRFYIDQLAREIYNPDSLPIGTDVAHVICNASSKNSGVIIVVHKNIAGEDSLTYYSSSDSLDFTEPREFRVYSNDGMAYRAYKVRVNVHKEDPDSTNWQAMGLAPVNAVATDLNMLALGDRLLLFNQANGATEIYATQRDAMSWETVQPNIALNAEACTNAMTSGGYVYTLNGSELIRSADGAVWETVGQTQLARLLGAGKEKMYGQTTDGNVASSADGGATWTLDNVLGDAAMLPATDVSLACLPLDTDDNAETVIMVGNRDINAYPADSVAMVWNKIEEYSTGSHGHSWVSCNEENGYTLPRLAGLKVMAYGDNLIAFGGSGLGTSTATAFANVYASEDNGLTWHADGSYYLPEDFDNGGIDMFAATVDGDNFIWIVCGGTGQIWRGRLNRLGWEDVQTSFTE